MYMSLFTPRRAAVAGSMLAGALVLTACGSGSSSDDAGMPGNSGSTTSHGMGATGSHNNADVTFSTQMIPHHGQAVEMATMALTQASNGQVRDLATAIKGGQDPEMTMMSGWMTGWGQQVPSGSSMSDMDGMGADASANGMMSDAEMQRLGQARGATFDRLWVQLMTRHHQGAVRMCCSEVTDGQSSEAKALAQQIITTQTREIATLTALAKTLPA